ncbi:MAG: flagellar biosynthesis anti-sigma factor FlgM [Candidatus Competibacteraceae bacterium]|nr:flagellar biosynthesis anti-sigma factor FlgM [Candidatus Competibacteraceae bacterium]
MAINLINGMYAPPARASGGQVDRVAPARPDQVGALPDQPVAEVDQVNLTSNSLNLRQMEIQNAEPPIDRERVAALREAIASGQYKMDSARIANKLLDFETRLFA